MSSKTNIISTEVKKEEMELLKINIGNYFISITTKQLFGCKDDDEVCNCLRYHIDIVEEILNNNLPSWRVVNKCNKKK